MVRIVRVGLFLLVAAGAAFAAESPFAGKWKLNPDKSEFAGPTIRFEETAPGTWKMTAAGQSYTFKVDGQTYPATFGATAAWTPGEAGTWQAVYKMADSGVLLSTDTVVLSADGKTLTVTSRGTTPNGEKFEEVSVYLRTAGTAGLAGTWKSTKVQISSPNAWEIAATEGDGLTWTIPAYQATVNLKFDGADYAAKGPTVPRGLTLSLRRIDPRSFEMTQKLDGKVVFRGTYTLSGDGKTLTVVSTAEGTNETVKAVYERQ